MFSDILFVVAAIVAMTVLVAEDFLLETLAIQLETFGPFAIAAQFPFASHIILFSVDWRRQKAGIASFTAFGKRWWGIPDGVVLDWKTLVDSFLERFSEWLWIEWVLCVNGLSLLFGILPGAFVLHFRGDQSLVGAGAVKYFTEIIGFKQALFGPIGHGLHYGLLGQQLSVFVFMYEELIEEILPVNRTLFFNVCCFSDFG